MNEFIEKKDKVLLIFCALLLGILFNYFFYGKTLGLSYPVYVFLLLTLFWWNTRKMLVVRNSFGWFLLIPVFLLSATFAVYSNLLLQLINFLLIPVLIVAYTLIATEKISGSSGLGLIRGIFKRVIPLTIRNFPQPYIFMMEELKTKESATIHGAAWKKIIIGLLISIPLLLVIIPLLSSADMIFNYYVTNLTSIIQFIDLKPIIKQGIIILFVFTYLFSYIWSYYTDHSKPETDKGPKTLAWDPTIVLTVLVIINLVYLLFSVIQFSYLYGGDRHSLPDAFTYAEYARRGFFELVAVTVINLSILLSSLKFVKNDNQTYYGIVRIFLSLLIVFSLNMLFSAHFKMSLYEEAYGLTYLRFFVHYFLGLLLVLFLLAAGNIWLNKPPLVKSYIIVSLLFYTLLNFLNVDMIIARNNISLYTQTHRIDVYYLQGLSYDAVPEIIKLKEDKNPEIARQIQDYLLMRKQDLVKETPWQSFNYSRHKAASTLESN